MVLQPIQRENEIDLINQPQHLQTLHVVQQRPQEVDLDNVANVNVGPEIHVRLFQRKAHKYICTIEGLSKEIDFKKMVKQMKDQFHCNGSFTPDGTIQLQGDHRNEIIDFLTKKKICKKNEIKVHGC